MTTLGLGLIGIGRPWPTPDAQVPPADEVDALLHEAIRLGITHFDTAGAYGSSELRLGSFLSGLPAEQRSGLFVATKAGELWTPSNGSVTDHRPSAMADSVRRSHELLGHINLLQVHKATRAVIEDQVFVEELHALQAEHGIDSLGVSVSDLESAEAALVAGWVSHVQLPVNQASPAFADWARQHGSRVTILGNRPLASGRLVGSDASVDEAIRFACDALPTGVVLTGTTNPDHLRATCAAFTAAKGSLHAHL